MLRLKVESIEYLQHIHVLLFVDKVALRRGQLNPLALHIQLELVYLCHEHGLLHGLDVEFLLQVADLLPGPDDIHVRLAGNQLDPVFRFLQSAALFVVRLGRPDRGSCGDIFSGGRQQAKTTKLVQIGYSQFHKLGYLVLLAMILATCWCARSSSCRSATVGPSSNLTEKPLYNSDHEMNFMHSHIFQRKSNDSFGLRKLSCPNLHLRKFGTNVRF